MGGFLGAAALLVIGAIGGYFLRTPEYRRDQRLKVYAEYLGAFLDAASAGASLQSGYSSRADDGYLEPEIEAELAPEWERWRSANKRLEEALASIALVGSEEVREKAVELERWYATSIRGVKPVRATGPEPTEGAAKLDEGARKLARDLGDAGRQDFDGRPSRLLRW